MAMSPTMASMTGMATSTSTAAASKGMSGMSGMGGMGGGSACKISGRPSPRESISKTGDIEANDNAKHDAHQISVIPKSSDSGYALVAKPQRLVPTVLQQAIRALIHMLQFAVAYFIMLLAMYYNGYIIICIIIGAYLGSFIFSWEGIHIIGQKTERRKQIPLILQTSAQTYIPAVDLLPINA
ncbi:MAG: hypothetical protein Q9188_003366 [Gyalolechia gomerana]